MKRNHRLLSATLVGLFLLILTAACGQKPGVALPPGTKIVDGQVVDIETGEVLGSVEDILGSGTTDLAGGGLGTDTSGTGGTTTTTGGGSGTDTGSDTGTGGGTGGGNAPPPSGGNTTGVTDKVIKIGLHAPLTGAAPVPSDSVEIGKDLYFRWMADQGQSLFGRTVQVVLKNDQYNPSTAVAVCKEMVEKDEVFMLTGGAGTDQIQACARYAASVGVPYLGAGVTELVLNQLPNYFAQSMTYNDQGPLLADFLVSDLGAKTEKNGMLTFDTPNFEDARQGFLDGMKKQGAPVVYNRRVSKGAGITDARSVVQEMSTQQLENVFVLTSPTWFIQVINAANEQGFRPQWVGVGISMTFDTVANVACKTGNSMNGAKFFAPFPAWFDSNRFDPEFRQAVNKFHPNESGGDDFMWLGWSGAKMFWEMLKRNGADLTREGFMYNLERMRNLKNGIGPELSYAPGDHFGADTVHVSEARCNDNKWHTIASFVNSF